MINWNRLIPGIRVGFAISVLVSVAYITYSLTDSSWRLHFAKLENQANELRIQNAKLEASAERITIQEVTRYVDRVRVIRERAETIVREVPVYVTPEAVSACAIPDGFVWLHDIAASRETTISGAPTDPNAATSGVDLARVAETVTTNYGKCHEIAEQLVALQQWITIQRNLFNRRD